VTVRGVAAKKRKKYVMTTADYLLTDETVLPRELAFGVLRVADSPVVLHQRVVRDLTIALTLYANTARVGEILPAPMDVILDFQANLVVQPDIVFVSNARSEIVSHRILGAPDLAIEVLSPHPRIGRVHEKIEWFARYGVSECWLVDLPKRQFAVLTFEDGRVAGRRLFSDVEPIVSTVLPGLHLRPFDIFGYV
jgi:Uma2 family endonuclease